MLNTEFIIVCISWDSILCVSFMFFPNKVRFYLGQNVYSIHEIFIDKIEEFPLVKVVEVVFNGIH